ncbi:mannitol dehydrogenase family protein [Pseudokordiimonas caeni]|uniref:mannitol dehydrogenase family protein n=1 Tax=Pseudokordiimonas caeni TaxID=2997908 RepID=UPI002811E1D9|nr:mannitol dehydrogenase family protein [Pseudokordiimonas caeni]
MDRLSLATLQALPQSVAPLSYDPARHGAGIVHLGVGAFHRSHQAHYCHKVLAELGGDWRIIGVSLRSAGVRDQMVPQDCLYSLVTKGPEKREIEIIGSIADILVAPENPTAVVDAIAAPTTHVVTLTITEKGYCLDNATGKLDMHHPDILHDLAKPAEPRTAIAFVVAALARRRAAGTGGLTIISCDNLAGNGPKLKAAVTAFASVSRPDILDWIADNVTFPATMVDRIAPAVLAEDVADVAATLGLVDSACVMTEPFTQWVIEENFAGPVPAWNRVGATYVNEVAPFEEMKLRLLNASHSAIAYLGCLAGYATVAEAIADPAMAALVRTLMRHEMAPTLSLPAGFSTDDYCDQLLVRFANRGLPHKTRQIAMDGSQKIPQRYLPALSEQLDRQGPIEAIAFAVSAWLRYTAGRSDAGETWAIDDPLRDRFLPLADLKGRERVDAFLAIRSVFPAAIAGNVRFKRAVTHWLTKLEAEGARQSLKDFAAQMEHAG